MRCAFFSPWLLHVAMAVCVYDMARWSCWSQVRDMQSERNGTSVLVRAQSTE